MIFFFSPVRIHNRREQSCDCSLLRDILRLNERGLPRRRGFAIWLRGAAKNGPLCVRPGLSGAAVPAGRSRCPTARRRSGRAVWARVPRAAGRRSAGLGAAARRPAPGGLAAGRTAGPRRTGASARAGRGGGQLCGCGSPIVRPARQWAARGGTCSPERPINRRRVQLPSAPPREPAVRRGRLCQPRSCRPRKLPAPSGPVSHSSVQACAPGPPSPRWPV